MMRIALILGALIAMMMTSCITVMNIKESNEIEARSGKLNNFDELAVSSNVKVKIVESDEFGYVMQYDTILRSKISISQIGGKVWIGLKDMTMFANCPETFVDLFVPSEWLNSEEIEMDLSGSSRVDFDTLAVNFKKMDIDISGASSFEATKINSTNVEVEASGASRGTIKGEFGKLKVDISGASTMNVGGTAIEYIAETSGASNVYSGNLKVDKIESARASGASTMVLGEANRIETMRASGASSIRYSGNPQIDEKNTSGASSISKK